MHNLTKADLAIDKHALDEEIVRQPQLFSEISEQAVMSAAERDAAKENLKVVDAALWIDWRTKLKDGKVTEKLLDHHVVTDPDHEKAFNTWLDAKTKADNAENLKDAFQQRSSMLRDLVSLYTSNYYQEASMRPSAASEASHYAANRSHLAKARAGRSK